MNDYVRGAFEALNWVEALLADIEPAKDPRDQLKKAVTEVEEALADIKEGVAVDFRHKLKIR